MNEEAVAGLAGPGSGRGSGRRIGFPLGGVPLGIGLVVVVPLVCHVAHGRTGSG